MLLANQQVELNLCNQHFVITLNLPSASMTCSSCLLTGGLTTGAGLLIKRGGELKLPAPSHRESNGESVGVEV